MDVMDGTILLVMLNAGTQRRVNEAFEQKQLGELVRGFGLDWNNDTHYSDIETPAGYPCFYDVPNFHYGIGCCLNILPSALNPEVLLEVDPDFKHFVTGS